MSIDQGCRGAEQRPLIDVERALAYQYPAITTSYDQRDLVLYALGIGAAQNHLNPRDLRFVWEGHGDFCALPTYGVVPALNITLRNLAKERPASGLNFGVERVIHSEQYTELKRPLPLRATLIHRLKIKAIYGRLRNAVLVVETRSFDEQGDLLVCNESTMVVRGAVIAGGEHSVPRETNVVPERVADAVVSQPIDSRQALLYRLSGDENPLHVDPELAHNYGLSGPILHGLCTYGYAVRHVIQACANHDPSAIKSIRARFSNPVFPGETLATEMWRQNDSRVIFRCKTLERNRPVITNAVVELR